MADINLVAPHLSGTMRESTLYRTMGAGLTDTIFLVGHADGLELNDPYQVASIQEAVNVLGADVRSPLLRGLLEAYYAGARDIWLVAAATMDEYESVVASRNDARAEFDGLTFNEKYFERLVDTYTTLREFDFASTVVPLEASIYGTDSVDFVTQLVDFCVDTFTHSGTPVLGIIGMRGTLDAVALADLLADTKFDGHGAGGKFVLVVAGEVSFNMRELDGSYAGSAAAVAAGKLSTHRLDKGLTYVRLPNVVRPAFRDLTPAQVQSLAERKINVIVQTTLGRRGTPYEVSLATDNTLADSGSDFWSLPQMRLVIKIMHRIRALGKRDIGQLGYADFKTDVQQYMLGLSVSNVIREFNLDIYRLDNDRGQVNCDVVVKPYFGLRELSFTASVGPGDL